MAGQRITKRLVDSVAPTGAEFTIWDCDLAGFGLRVRPSGARSYVITYRAGHGRKAPVRKLTIGAVGKLSPDEARRLARDKLAEAAKGGDPAAEKAEERRGLTVAELADAFMREHILPKRKPTTAGQYRHAIDAHIKPAFGTEKADRLTRAAVARLHLSLEATPSAANYALAVISSMYGFAARRGLVPDGHNPGARIEKYREQGRERFLSTSEIERLGEVLREAETAGLPYDVDTTKPGAKHAPRAENRRTVYSPHVTAAIRLLLLTGCRLREVLHLKWEHVDLERGLLHLPDSKTGKKVVVLSAPAGAVLAELPRAGRYVIAGESPDAPRSDLKKPWSRIAARAGLDGLRLHDLRHSYASIGAGAGLGLPIVGKLLGHSQPATTARYAHLDADPLRRAADRIGGTIAAALEGKPPGEVIPLRGKR
jgi:integrase